HARIKVLQRILDDRAVERETLQNAPAALAVHPPEHGEAMRRLELAAAQQQSLHLAVGHRPGDQRVDRVWRQDELFALEKKPGDFRLVEFKDRIDDGWREVHAARDKIAMGLLALTRRLDE